MKKQQKMNRMIVLLGLFIALSVIGGYIKIPGPISSIAFDSLPAFLAALILGSLPGVIVGFLGHMVSAAIGGFPLSLPIHLIVALEMAVVIFVFNYTGKRVNLIAATIVGIILNGFGSPVILIFIPGLGLTAFIGSILPLTIASICNISIATLIYKSIKSTKIVKELQEVNNGL